MVRIIGMGSTSGIVEGAALINGATCVMDMNPGTMTCSSSLVTKVMTSKIAFDEEVLNAKYMYNVDPDHSHFLYPFAAFFKMVDSDNVEVLRDIAVRQQSFTILDENRIDPDAKVMYLLVMQDGGVTVANHKEYISLDDARLLIADLLDGLSTLHGHGFSHGDIHEHNAVICKGPEGMRAYWIDFGKISRQRFAQLADVKKCIGVIKAIFQMVPSEKRRAIRPSFAKMEHMTTISSVQHCLLMFDLLGSRRSHVPVAVVDDEYNSPPGSPM